MPGIHIVGLIALQALWAGSYIAIKIALREIPLDLLILLRFGGAALLLLFWTTVRGAHRRVSLRDFKWIIILGVVVYVASPLLAFNGIRMTQALDVAILVSLEPLATALLAFMIIKERLDRRRALAVAIAIPGVLLLSGIDKMALTGGAPLRLIGNLLFIASLFCEGAHTVFGRAFSRRIPPLTLSAYTFSAGFFVFLLIDLQRIPSFDLAAISTTAWLSVAYLAIACSAIGYTAWFVLLKTLPANTAALSLYLQPVFGALFGHLILGEGLSLSGMAGALLILTAMWCGFGRTFRSLPSVFVWRIKRT